MKWLANEWTRVPKEYRPAMVIGAQGAVFDDWESAQLHLMRICEKRVAETRAKFNDAVSRLNIAQSAIDPEA